MKNLVKSVSLALSLMLTNIIMAQNILKIEGTVQKIENGKDGYTATLQTDDNKIYFATVSIPNLGENHAEYRRVEVGEKITVESEGATADSQYLAVSRLYPAENAEDTNNFKAKGVVKSIENGKDGYTAKMVSKDKKVYFVTISIVNLLDSNEYRRVKIGETIEVQGEYWLLGKDKRITVRKLF